MTFKHVLLFLFAVFITPTLSAQDIADGFFSARGEGSVSASFVRSNFNAFYVGEVRAWPVPVHNEITQKIYNIYGKYGITDNLTVVVNAPFIAAEGDGNVNQDTGIQDADPVNGLTDVSGVQDISVMAKYRPFSAQLGEGGSRFDGIAAVGVAIPTGYEPNGILSLGSGAFTTDLRLGGHLQLGNGLFATGLAGYSLRGEADNTNGGTFDVPNNYNFTGKIGYAGATFFAEAFIRNQTSTDGVDIGGEGFAGNFPETRVDYTMVGGTLYIPFSSRIGGSRTYGTVIDGRNVGDANYLGAGLSFNFARSAKK